MIDKTDTVARTQLLRVALAELIEALPDRKVPEHLQETLAPWLDEIEALPAQPAEAVAEVVDLYGTGVKVPAWIGTGPAPDIPVGTKLYVGIPPAASVDDAVGCPTCGAPCSERRIVDGPHSSHYEYTYTPLAASVDASAIMEVVERYAGKTANATKYIRQDLLKLIDSAGGAKCTGADCKPRDGGTLCQSCGGDITPQPVEGDCPRCGCVDDGKCLCPTQPAEGDRTVEMHVRHEGSGLLALYNGDKQIREIGITPGWHFKDRDEFIFRYNNYTRPSAAAAVPEGFVLVPRIMHLDADTLQAASFIFGGEDGEFCDTVLSVGITTDNDGKETYGLFCYSVDYPEEGTIPLLDFAAPAAPKFDAEIARLRERAERLEAALRYAIDNPSFDSATFDSIARAALTDDKAVQLNLQERS